MTSFQQPVATAHAPSQAPPPPEANAAVDQASQALTQAQQQIEASARTIALARVHGIPAIAFQRAPRVPTSELRSEILQPDLPPGLVFTHVVDSLVPVLIIVALVLGLLSFLRLRTGRGSARQPQLSLQPVEQRLDRLEQSVLAIGVEVERMTEGQRFLTKLLRDDSRAPAQLPKGEQR